MKINSRKGQLDDYGWLNGNPGASDWPHHTDTLLNYANEFDLADAK
ncbi:omptin family outer membrane protease [Escherichia coli]|nr:omptin family outer membrane protease [Escherichia coli]